jgi:hypothetical protein
VRCPAADGWFDRFAVEKEASDRWMLALLEALCLSCWFGGEDEGE